MRVHRLAMRTRTVMTHATMISHHASIGWRRLLLLRARCPSQRIVMMKLEPLFRRGLWPRHWTTSARRCSADRCAHDARHPRLPVQPNTLRFTLRPPHVDNTTRSAHIELSQLVLRQGKTPSLRLRLSLSSFFFLTHSQSHMPFLARRLSRGNARRPRLTCSATLGRRRRLLQHLADGGHRVIPVVAVVPRFRSCCAAVLRWVGA